MTEESHEQARRLLLESWIENLAPENAVWLQSHLASCESCRRLAAGLEDGVHALHSTIIPMEPALVDATKCSVRLYAERVRETRSRTRLLAVSCALSAIWGGVSLPWLWRAFAWLGSLANLPAAAWQAAFILFWVLPGMMAAAALLVPSREARSWHEQRSQLGEQR